jgi:2-polyprenyl-3-methyl-5-hydroxy-6-metoxy-1,4-benzoquinol methylase
MAFTDGQSFLDVGCKSGLTVVAALDLGLDARGIDIDAPTIEIAKKTYGDNLFENTSIQEFAAKGESADIIHATDAIGQAHDPDLFVSSIYSILPVDGILFLAARDAGHFALTMNLLSRTPPTRPPNAIFFTKCGMFDLLRRHGFKIEKFILSITPGLQLIARKR